MDRYAELDIGRNFTIAVIVFAVGSAAFFAAQGVEGAVFRTILATSVFLTTGVVAMMLWEIGDRAGQLLPRLLALSLAVVVVFELLHTLAILEPLANVVIAGQRETRWRAGTWGPTAHLLPLAMLAILLLPERMKTHVAGFVAVLFAIGLALLGFFEWVPRFNPPSVLGITRLSLILAPILWAAAGYLCWQRRTRDEILRMFAMMSLIMVLTNIAVLYSQTANDAPAMIGHFGKFVAKLFFLISLMEMTAREMSGRQQAERALQTLNMQLEHRVQERTKQVEQSNDALKGEVMRRQQAERRLQIQFDRLSLIDRITRSVAARQDMPSIFQVVIRSLEDQMPADFVVIGLYKPDEHIVTIAHLGVKNAAGCGCDCDAGGDAHPRRRERLGAFDQRRAGLRTRHFGIVVHLPVAARRRWPQGAGDRAADDRRGRGRCDGDRPPRAEQLYQHGLRIPEATLRACLARRASGAATRALQAAYDDLRQTRQTVMQQERLRALGQMASGIAHDINNAISPMALHTQSLIETGGNMMTPRLRNYLEIVSRVTDDVTATVARMREFYRERDPDTPLGPVNLNQLADQVIDLTRARWSDMPQRAGMTIEMRTDLAIGLPAARGVDNEIREALTNLIFNAVDAMPQGGRLTVRTGVAPEVDAGRRVQIEVIDTGIGMDDETRRRCLEPFFTTKGERGTGLGLAMVYGVAQRLGADLTIESELGKGTTLRMIFAVADQPSAAASKEPAAPVSVPSLRILIIDDDPVILDSMRLVLELDGHTVASANDGRAGVDVFRAAHAAGEAFAVVITDLGMPYMDGHEVARAVKETSATTPVILLTGWGRRMTGDRDMPANVDRTLDKPPKLPELREAIANTLAMAGQ